MQRYALINASGIVENSVLWDGETDWAPPSGYIAVQSDTAGIGDTYANGAFTAPAAPEPAPLTAAQQRSLAVSAAFAAGLTITSTSTPAINGTYAVDQAAQSRINAIETAILKNGAFPGSSGSQMAYPDIAGKLTVFPSTALFSEFATSVANYVADLDLYAAGATGATLPNASVTIA